jgi:hypothetical protein
MEEPIKVILESVPLWERLLTLLAPLLGGALAVVAGILIERRRSTFLRRREQLGIRRPDVSAIETPSGALYDCSKRIHYQRVIHEYEALEADIHSYDSQCLEYVQSLAARIEQYMGLPNRMPMETGASWVRAEALALHIYQRQQGLEALGVRLRSAPTDPTNTVELPHGDGAVIQVTQDQAKKALELVTELENNRARLDELHSRGAGLQRRATELRNKLERLLYTSSLSGKCDFLIQ